ncbi:MAG: AAA family ATPase [Porticoccaceae bacterium]|nr:AAA family ATPase [Porticoccaceae bacterium]
MIREIEITNFRSIRHDSISLEPFTVLIGANGSGKSNLVKALEFLSDLPSAGIDYAVSKQGGRDGILPKEIPIKEIARSPTIIRYKVCLPPPDDDASRPTSVDVVHEFKLGFTKKNTGISIKNDELTFHKVLYVGRRLNDAKKTQTVELGAPEHPNSDSLFRLTQRGKRVAYDFDPPISKETLDDYVHWLGLDVLRDQISTPNELKQFLSTYKKWRNTKRSGLGGDNLNEPKGLLTDPAINTAINFAPQNYMFLTNISSIRRYDLLLHELRQEQPPSDSAQLSKVGANMPSAFRKLASDSGVINRLRSSFDAIAPHIREIKASSLRTGKEFIEFVESVHGRGIESWESSDGSLRALAILVALETADEGQTVIIEEPEQNLHPWAIRTVIDHMKTIVEEKGVQIIVTTHSEHVLERVNADEVRVVSRSRGKGTIFKRIDQIITGRKIVMGEVGRLWVKGLLGGVPEVEEDML